MARGGFFELLIEGSLVDLPCEPDVPCEPGLDCRSDRRSGVGSVPLEARVRALALETIETHGGTEHVDMDPRLVTCALLTVDPASLDAGQQVEYFTVCQRLTSWTQARQVRALAAFADQRPPLPAETPKRRHPETSRWAAAEVGAALGISRLAGERKLVQAQDLVDSLPGVLAAQETGELDQRHVSAVLDGLDTTPREVWPAVETFILPRTGSLTSKALEKYVRQSAEKLNPEPLAVRYERARTSRDVWFFPQPDGMAEIGARLPAADARRLYETIDAWARHAQKENDSSTGATPGGKPSRAVTEYRADIFLDLFDLALNAADKAGTEGMEGTAPHAGTARRGWRTGCGRHAPAQIAVTVPVLTLMGLNEMPATVDGYGPIPAHIARELAAKAKSWIRILTHPETGTILSIGRTGYTPPADLKRWIIHRDQTCTGIGCDKPARTCDIDHTVPYHRQTYTPDGTPLPLGKTADTNLGARCDYDHHLKDNPGTGWTVTQPTPGTFTHTSPTGRTYTKNPQPPPF
ncbi:DUF222 domain-containing protein [Arthrobacter sp. H14-L1]|uniref:DUF222 domain-containing protein n=1 Tax=Arthrobacter sp. H14-L1 TaxID=2996697 RepID=UPI00226D4818|nr:DUF222 domain-containing protein [Arthrobacter sp. H14-L1]